MKESETKAAPSTWSQWFVPFDGMYFGTTKIIGILNGIDQRRPLLYKEKDVHVLSNDDVILQTPPPPPSSFVTSSITLCSKATRDLGYERQVNRSANKKKRKIFEGDNAVPTATSFTSYGLLELEKMKLKLAKKSIENKKEGRKLAMEQNLHMIALFANILKNKNSFTC